MKYCRGMGYRGMILGYQDVWESVFRIRRVEVGRFFSDALVSLAGLSPSLLCMLAYTSIR